MKRCLTHLTLALCLIPHLLNLQAEPSSSSDTEILMLSGTGSDDTVEWDFWVSGGRNAQQWSRIPVPSNWEMQGFGSYHYWRDWGEDATDDSEAVYRHAFTVPDSFHGRQVQLVFGAVMTDTTVFLNGEQVGPTHQGGFYEFSYDVTPFLNIGGRNELRVEVQKFSSNVSVNEAEREADYWLFGGIYRPVWLESRPSAHIDHVAVDARHDGSIAVQVELQGVTSESVVNATIQELGGNVLGNLSAVDVAPGQTALHLSGTIPDVKSWTAETPHRYELVLELQQGNALVHRVRERIGFRTVEVKPGVGIFVNGQRIVLKGVNRHSFWPDSGRATHAALSIADVKLMKEMNLNAVRMSHYPPDSHFLDACDELGLYVIDELGGWQKAYDTEVGKQLVRETVRRDVNHPSIILWANGNEGGWNTELDAEFAKHDPQQRVVIHPWSLFNGINTSHYEDYNSGVEWFFNGQDLILPTEFLHGLYDGGHGAGLNDWWQRMLAHPLGAGGFLWAFADEGIVREDLGGAIDVAGNRAPDGIVGPYREREASFFTIKEIWSPVYVRQSELDTLTEHFDGWLDVENRYDFTDLNTVSFRWELQRLSGNSIAELQMETIAQGQVKSPSVAPWHKGRLFLDMPDHWYRSADVLSLSAHDANGHEIYTWTWSITLPSEVVTRMMPERQFAYTQVSEHAEVIVMENRGVEVQIDRESGRLVQFSRNGVNSPLTNGVQPIGFPVGNLTAESVPGGVRFASDNAILRQLQWTLDDAGYLALHYDFRLHNQEFYDAIGVSFDYDESEVTGIQWLGKGPYRVWKNRRKGVEFGLWDKAYNDTITGLSWDYPEFKGFHDDVALARLSDARIDLEILIPTPAVNLRLFTPAEAAEPAHTTVTFPPGDLSFLHAFPPIGTKFKPATRHGPEGQPSWSHRGGQHFRATIYFRLLSPDRKEGR